MMSSCTLATIYYALKYPSLPMLLMDQWPGFVFSREWLTHNIVKGFNHGAGTGGALQSIGHAVLYVVSPRPGSKLVCLLLCDIVHLQTFSVRSPDVVLVNAHCLLVFSLHSVTFFFQLVAVTCNTCRKNFCLKHRFETDHECQGPPNRLGLLYALHVRSSLLCV